MARKKKSVKSRLEAGQASETPAQPPIHKEPGAVKRPGSSIVKTCLLFAGILAGLHAFTWLFALKGYIKWGSGTAHIVSTLLNATGIENSVDFNTVRLRNDTWNVTSECTAVNAVFLFVAFVLAYSSTYRSKALGLVAGIPLIVAVNILRLFVLGWVTEYWPRHAHLFHDYVWETVFLFFILFLWFVWINLVVNREKNPAVSR